MPWSSQIRLSVAVQANTNPAAVLPFGVTGASGTATVGYPVASLNVAASTFDRLLDFSGAFWCKVNAAGGGAVFLRLYDVTAGVTAIGPELYHHADGIAAGGTVPAWAPALLLPAGSARSFEWRASPGSITTYDVDAGRSGAQAVARPA